MKAAGKVAALVLGATGCGGSAHLPYVLNVGSDTDGGSGSPVPFVAGDGSTAAGGLTITVANLPATICPGQCVAIDASASGGTAPYTFSYSGSGDTADGGTFEACPKTTTTYTISAHDSSGRTGDLVTESLTGKTQVTVTVSQSCGPADAGREAAPSCDIGTMVANATSGNVVYYDDGGALPPGNYVVTYVDGCMKYSLGQGWMVQASAAPGGQGMPGYYLVGTSTTDEIVMPPGTVTNPISGYAQFQDCVTANLALPPLTFDFDGGPIGVWLYDSPYSDNADGTNDDDPTWRLSREGVCPTGFGPQ